MSGAQSTSTPHSTTGQRAAIGVAIVAFAAMSAYLALVIITRVDSIFFPGNEITIPGGTVVQRALPGVDTEGDSGPQDPINILVLGLDRRPSDGDSPSRTDTIFIVRVNPKTHSAAILGVPRDLIVEIPLRSGGTYEDRINTVYVAGELNGYSQGGMGLMKEVIFQNWGVKIDKHVLVDFEGFEEVIDALGGIDVDVPEPVFDPYYSETELPGDYFPQDFEAGRQHMDGRTALAYSRIRFSSDDLDRIQRQQRVIFATIDKAKTLNVLSDAPDLWRKYKDTISTDINDALIPGYALLANQVKDEIISVSLGPATVPYTTPQGAAVLIGDEEAIAQIIDSVFSADPNELQPQEEPEQEPVRVQVQNGTGSEGLAARIVNYIATQGYPVDDLNPANVFDGQPKGESAILDLDGTHEKNAYLLAKWLGIDVAAVRQPTPTEMTALNDADAEIIVILGDDVAWEELIQSPTTTTPGG